MNVLFIVPDFYPHSTGFSNASQGLINAIHKYGSNAYKVFVYTSVPLVNEEEYKNTFVSRHPYKKHILENRFTVKYFARKRYEVFKKFVIVNKIDVLFFETNTFSYLQNWALEDFGSKAVVRIHSTADTEVPVFDFSNSVYSINNRKNVFNFMQNIENIVSTSTYYLDFVKHHYLEDNVYRIWNNKSYSILYNTVSETIETTTVVSNNSFLSMGKMSDNGLTQKGMLDLIEAVSILKHEGTLPEDFIITIIGDGVKLPFVRKYIECFGVGSYINIINKASHDEVFEIMKKVKAIILLSRYEGQSMFITESISNGKPLVVSDNNGMQDMIIDSWNGYITKTGDPNDAAKQIKKMINAPKEDLQKFSDNSLELFNKKFSPESVYKQFDSLMKKMSIKK